MKPVDTMIIGGGQAGLAISRCLTDRGHDHLVIERGCIGERWRSERWDSLRLLTPNWMSRLPGYSYQGPDPDGFMRRDEVVDFLAGYARSFNAPVLDGTTVLSVAPLGEGFRVITDQGTWRARHVVIATGHNDIPRVLPQAGGLSRDLAQVTTSTYRRPEQLPPGGVLVVGASASGAQLADELRRSGRQVLLSVGRHNRLPRSYRGLDIMWWLDRLGILDRSISDMPDPEEARREPSLQLVGKRSENLDLGILASRGVRLAGRLAAADGWRVRFARDLPQAAASADDRLEELLARIDYFVSRHGLDGRVAAAERITRLALDEAGPEEVNLRASGIRTVLWATGFRRLYPWLHASVLDARGEIRHHRGRTSLPGLYVLGLQFMTRRRSSFLDGVGRDAEEIADQIHGVHRREAVAAA